MVAAEESLRALAEVVTAATRPQFHLAELSRREDALARAEQDVACLEALHVPTDDFADVSLREVWSTLLTDERRRALAAVIDCVVLRRGPERLERRILVIPAGRERD